MASGGLTDWRSKAREWGTFVREDDSLVTLWRKGQHCRFYDETGTQVGPEHANVMPAMCWMYATTEWYDTDGPRWLTDACRREVRANSRMLDGSTPTWVD